MIKEQESRQKPAKKVFPETSLSLPTLRVNKAEGAVSIDGRVMQFRKYSVIWRVFLFLASKPNVIIDGLEIKRIERQAGSRSGNERKSSIRNLRKLVEDDCRKPLIIATAYFGGHCGKYRLNAKIEFTEENFLPEKTKKEKKTYLKDFTGRQEKIAYALFSINQQKTGFKNSYMKDAVVDICKNELSTAGEKGDWKLLKGRYNALTHAAHTVAIEKIRGNWDKPPEQRLPKIRKFIEWLMEQPEYASITLEDLELVARRKISFEELRKKADPAPVVRQIFPQRVVERPPMPIPVLTPEEIFVLAYNFSIIKTRNKKLLAELGVDLGGYDNEEITRLANSLRATIEIKIKKNKKLNHGRVFFDKQALIASLRKKIDAFKEDPSAFLGANKPEAKILLKYFVNLEKEKLAVLLSALCP